MSRRKRIADTLAYIALILVCSAMILPFIWSLSTALKGPGKVFLYPPQWIPDPIHWENFLTAWNRVPFGRFLLNTAFVSVAVVGLQLVTCSLSAYAFARMKFPGRDKLFLLYLGTLMIPGQVVIIPNFILMRYFGWLNTYSAMILPAAFSAFGTFLLRQFFLTIPYELEEAAVIDGCSRFGLYRRIILPLAKPAMASLAIFTFRSQWNAFLWPLIVVNDTAKMLIQVGLSFFRGMYYTEWELLLAGTLIALIPTLVVFAFGQRYFTQGIALSGLGGR
ncbi:MAG: carbohydrate ABC transporter permease [Limnochordia bacterium]